MPLSSFLNIPFRLLPLAVAVAGIAACREKPPQKKGEAEAKPHRGRPERIRAATAAPSIRRQKEAKMKELGMGVQFMEKGRYFTRREVEGLEVDALLDKIAGMPKEDRSGAAFEMVLLFPAGEWRKMLEFANRLPIAKDSESAVRATGAKLAKTAPHVWTDHHALLKEKLSEAQYGEAASEFGKALAARENVLAEIHEALAAPGLTPAAREKFLDGLVEALESDEGALATALLPKLADAERVRALRHNTGLFKDIIVPGDAALVMVRSLAPAQQERMAEALGNLFGGKGPEAARTDVETMAAKLPPRQEKAFYVAYYEGMARIDLNKTMQSVPAISKREVRDAVLSRMIQKIRFHDKVAAVRWAETIADPKERQRLLDSLR